MNGEPNTWREEGGKLTHAYETEEYKQTITDLIAFWKAGARHPDSFNTAQPFKALFNAGTVAINAADGYPGWNQYILDNAGNPDFKLGLMPAYTRDGSKLAEWAYGSGVYSITTITKQEDPERLKMLLRVLNYLAAPFGTEEYLYRLYGENGVDHTTTQSGDPVLTKTGQADTVLPIRYLADAPYAVYQPDDRRMPTPSTSTSRWRSPPGSPTRPGSVLQHLRHQERHRRHQLPQRDVQDRPGAQAVLRSRSADRHLAQGRRRWDAQRVRAAAPGERRHEVITAAGTGP